MAIVISGIPFDNKLYISMCLLIMSCNKIASYVYVSYIIYIIILCG